MSSRLFNWKLDVRYVFMGDAGDEEYARLSLHLNPGECAQANRFLLLKDRLAFSTGRVLVRKILSQYATEPPGGGASNGIPKASRRSSVFQELLTSVSISLIPQE